ncbi:MAG: hypothetical protein QM723_38875 [Myxococcaceae bacterium]
MLTFSVVTAQPAPPEALVGPAPEPVEYAQKWHVHGIIASTLLGLESGLAVDLLPPHKSAPWAWTMPIAFTLVSAVAGHFLGDLAAKGSVSAKASVIAEYCLAATLVVLGAWALTGAVVNGFGNSGGFHWE